MKLTVLILCSLLQAMIMPAGYGRTERSAAAGPCRAVLKDKTSNGIRFDPLNVDAFNDTLLQAEAMLKDNLLVGARRPAAQSPTARCPQLVIACPLYIVEQDTQLRFSALVAGRDPHSELSYTWTLSGGTINNGQGTDSITVDTTGRAGR
ncbi:MAG TPA: hypothetical protein VE842_11650, partial [Pyrinomonadaceae bacterium]|nr:hypothetical protein [Pyrinomonadaceae bacterium]